MNKVEIEDKSILDLAQGLASSGQAFAYATVIRTAGATSAKPGAKAIISSDGQILKGWDRRGLHPFICGEGNHHCDRNGSTSTNFSDASRCNR